MHGKKREEYKAKLRNPKISAALSQKAEQWHALVNELAIRRKNNKQNQQQQQQQQQVDVMKQRENTLGLIEKALLVNPDPLYLWNHRRELLLEKITMVAAQEQGQEQQTQNNDNNNTADDTNATTVTTFSSSSILQSELDLTQASLMRNPKAYGAWFHRKWILQQLRPNITILESELALTVQFLKLDERNFHCWNYRRFIISAMHNNNNNDWDGSWDFLPKMGKQLSSSTSTSSSTLTSSSSSSSSSSISSDVLIMREWNFTREKIQDNFSNFSAFHYRSQLLPYRLQIASTASTATEDKSTMEEIIQEELTLIENAICTEPDDQTAWWYQASLLCMNNDNDDDSTTMNALSSSLVTIDSSRLEEHADLLRELLEESKSGSNNNNTNKWILLGLHRVLDVLKKINNDDDDGVVEKEEEQKSLLEQLMQVDSDRSQRYQELLNGI